jgi:predicted Zn-dependent protease with MMP-like domain
MKKERFEKLAEEALRQVPQKFKKYIVNLAVIVEDRPSRDVYAKTGASPFTSILGVYHGVPFKYRGPYYGNIPPDVITIYQKPIEDLCTSDQDIKQKIKEVILHEIGHYFGLTEKQLQEIETPKKIMKGRR